jgi:hypothetical protein
MFLGISRGMQLWPFLVVTIGLFALVGYMVANTERAMIMQNWQQTRCTVPVLFAASFFKPDSDTRSGGQFAMDNFEFCMKSLVQDVMEVVMAPLFAIFGKHVSMAEVMTDLMNGVRKILATIYEAFLSFIDPFLKRYNATVGQINIVTQHLRLSFQRVNAVMMGMLFSGLSIIKGFQNMIDFVIKVVMIIVGIMVALIIILFFILFPFIPLILTVLSTIAAVAIGSVAAAASSSAGAFCFPETMQVALADGTSCNIKDVRPGQRLMGGAVVEATMMFDGKTTPLFVLDGIQVSGSHRVRHALFGWPLVKDDPRARPIAQRYDVLYCMTTSNRKIPMYSMENRKVVWFRDWEEMDADDEQGEALWNQLVLHILNGTPISPYATEPLEEHLLGPDVKVLTPGGVRRLAVIQYGDDVLSEDYTPCKVNGIVEGSVGGSVGDSVGDFVTGGAWWSGCLVRRSLAGPWERTGPGSTDLQNEQKTGRHLMTTTGSFLILAPDTQKMVAVRDYTEVGDRLPLTYSFIESRIRQAPLSL